MRLPRFGKDWRCRWLVTPAWGALHRVSSITWDDDDRIAGYGATACGRFARMFMPGFVSRMGLRRCSACCRAAGVPPGVGAPFNQGIDA